MPKPNASLVVNSSVKKNQKQLAVVTICKLKKGEETSEITTTTESKTKASEVKMKKAKMQETGEIIPGVVSAKKKVNNNEAEMDDAVAVTKDNQGDEFASEVKLFVYLD